jgi:site-specific recombinase XerD
MAYSTAARPCELLGLDVANVDLSLGLVRVLGKGDKERILPIGRTAQKVLVDYLRASRPLLLRHSGATALWLNDRGGRLGYDSLFKLMQQVIVPLSSQKVTWYDFRRSCATELARGGASLWAIKELLGHDRLETVRHYVHFTLDDLRRAHARCHPRNLATPDDSHGVHTGETDR